MMDLMERFEISILTNEKLYGRGGNSFSSVLRIEEIRDNQRFIEKLSLDKGKGSHTLIEKGKEM